MSEDVSNGGKKKMSTNIRINIDSDEYQRFGMIAVVRGVPKHELISLAIEEFVTNHYSEVHDFRKSVVKVDAI